MASKGTIGYYPNDALVHFSNGSRAVADVTPHVVIQH